MSFWTFFSNIPYVLLGLAGLTFTCVFAWFKERSSRDAIGIGSGRRFQALLGSDLVWWLSGSPAPALPLFISDGLISLGILYIAIRYSSMWLGVAMVFRALEFSIHAVQLTEGDMPRWHGLNVYVWAYSTLDHLVLITLSCGTIATILRRRRVEREKAAAAVKAANRAERFKAASPPFAGAA